MAEDTPMKQLDLFRDNPTVSLANALREALMDEDTLAATIACRALADYDASHHWLPHARTLIAALQAPVPTNKAEGLADMTRLEEGWTQAADAVLGDDSRDVLQRKWRAVGDALSGGPFDPGCPDLHASYAYAKCEDWASVERCIRAVPDFSTRPILLTRLAEAIWRQRRLIDAAGFWFDLCWSDPDRFQGLMDRGAIPDPNFREGWERWQDADLGPESSTAWFPAWMLVREPWIAAVTPRPGTDAPAQAAFAILRELTIGDGEDIELRRQLRHLHPDLLAGFLARR